MEQKYNLFSIWGNFSVSAGATFEPDCQETEIYSASQGANVSFISKARIAPPDKEQKCVKEG